MEKIAIVHEWFITFAGSERVIEQLLQLYPHADLFSLMDFLPQAERGFLGGRSVNTSFLQTAPFINRKNYRQALPLMPLAVEQLDLSAYDVILSNCHAVSKGVITAPGQLHISYIHSPIRYAWDMQNSYLETSGLKSIKGMLARMLLHYIRLWDSSAANRPDKLLANSKFIARRVEKIYRRAATVLYPPVDTEAFTPRFEREDFYLAASRLVPYKRIDLIVDAFRQMPTKRLVVIGDGTETHWLNNLPANITWLGYQSNESLKDHMQRCRAFIFAAKEDFGIIPLEAQACGAPVIAFGEGGVHETVQGPQSEKPSGVFFYTQSAEAIREAVREFERLSPQIRPEACRANAERFSNQRFRNEVQQIISSAWEQFQSAA